DIAYDLNLHGANSVAMVQRGTLSVTTQDSANLLYAAYADGISTEEADLVSAAGWIEPIQRATLQAFHSAGKNRDREFLTALTDAGLTLDDGPDDTGWVRKFWTAA